MAQIRELMSRPAVSCRINDSLSTAARLMWEYDLGTIPVTHEDGRLAGILTDRDICMATYTQGRPPQDIAISTVMAHEVCSATDTDSVEAAEQLMREKQVRRLPIVDRDSRPIGVLSLNDLIRYAATSRRKDISERDVVQTLAAISQPRKPLAQQMAQQAQTIPQPRASA